MTVFVVGMLLADGLWLRATRSEELTRQPRDLVAHLNDLLRPDRLRHLMTLGAGPTLSGVSRRRHGRGTGHGALRSTHGMSRHPTPPTQAQAPGRLSRLLAAD